jgi:branched-chain amino acid aminotransferase
MTSTFTESQSYKNGSWLPLCELAWGVTDLGTTQGAMLVERLRTFDGRLVDVDEHLTRLAFGAKQLGISWPPPGADFQRLCEELVHRNRELIIQESDVGLVILLSPGDPGIDRNQSLTPTILAHVVPLPFPQLARWYRNGVALHISNVRNVPAACWSPAIKTRSRLQYYLADQQNHRPIGHSNLSEAEKAVPSKVT